MQTITLIGIRYASTRSLHPVLIFAHIYQFFSDPDAHFRGANSMGVYR